MSKILSLLFLPALLLAGVVTHVLEFDRSRLVFDKFQGYDVVTLEDGFLVSEPGKPSLPVVSVVLSVPAGAIVTEIGVTALATEELAGRFSILPVQEPYPLSAQNKLEFTAQDPTVYGTDNPFPPTPLIASSSGNAAGFRLVGLNVCPFEFLPVSGRLRLHTRLLVTIAYEQDAPGPVLTPHQVEHARQGLECLVANPYDLTTFAPRTAEIDLPEVRYLIITSQQFVSAFTPLAEYKTSRGLRAEIRASEWIEQNWTGRDLQEKMRNFIRHYFQTRGLTHVLLAGDNAFVPSRRIRVTVSGTVGDIPTDLYYADLDYSWDSNRNNLFGEMSDSVDLYADVLLGRASVGNTTEVETFIRKVKEYEGNPKTDYLQRTLLPSGWLWRSQNYHGSILNDTIANITPAGWPDIKMKNPPGPQPVADSFDHGFAFFNPSGHGNPNGVYDEDGTPIYTSGLARAQTNDRRFTIMTSLACDPGDFEFEDCLAENAHNAPAGGCIAVMMNSRFGWGQPPSFGPSEKLCARFYDFLLKRNTFELAACHSRSREVYAASARTNSLWRWCMTEFNLFGDPSLDIWTDVPTQLTVSCPDTILTGGQTLSVSVSTQSGPVANALVCAWKESETQVTGRTNNQGQVSLSVRPLTPGTLKVTVSAHNRLPATESLVVKQGVPEPYIILARFEISDSGQLRPNGILEPGETARLILELKNLGAGAATNTSVTLRTLASGLTFPDSTAFLGVIPPYSIMSTDDLILRAAPNIAPGSSPEVICVVRSAEQNWDLVFNISIGYPGRVLADIDTGLCALTVTARGSIGFDNEGALGGRGFRFPKTDTSSITTASFCLANSPAYVVDRFYKTVPGQVDADWRMAESIYSFLPFGNARQLLIGSFSDAGHPASRGIRVVQRAYGTDAAPYNNFVIVQYDLVNLASQALNNVYAGILADFDVKATDRFHDVCYTSASLRTAYTRNVVIPHKVCGIKLLSPAGISYQGCIDHALYVYPDSGLSESMKYRILNGSLGLAASDRPYNWSVYVSTGPFDLASQDTQRLAFAFIAASDSVSYIGACERAQEWYESTISISEPGSLHPGSLPQLFAVGPNPCGSLLNLYLDASLSGQVHVDAFDVSGRWVARVYNGPAGRTVDWRVSNLPAGVYVLCAQAANIRLFERVTVVR